MLMLSPKITTWAGLSRRLLRVVIRNLKPTASAQAMSRCLPHIFQPGRSYNALHHSLMMMPIPMLELASEKACRSMKVGGGMMERQGGLTRSPVSTTQGSHLWLCLGNGVRTVWHCIWPVCILGLWGTLCLMRSIRLCKGVFCTAVWHQCVWHIFSSPLWLLGTYLPYFGLVKLCSHTGSKQSKCKLSNDQMVGQCINWWREAGKQGKGGGETRTVSNRICLDNQASGWWKEGKTGRDRGHRG